MSGEADGVDAGAKPKKSKGILIALVLAPLLGGGAFYGVYSGLIPLPFGATAPSVASADDTETAVLGFAEEARSQEMPAVAFVPLDEMVISLGPEARARHLKVRLSVEVEATAKQSVTDLTPRILDVLNTFLRAVDERDIALPTSMMRLRAQMLRRVRLVTPEGAVRDVLIQEFVLN